jgi:hypothetical protein
VFNNVDTMSLAIDLLEVNTKPQLDAAVRRIVRRAGETVGRPLNEPESGPTPTREQRAVSSASSWRA